MTCLFIDKDLPIENDLPIDNQLPIDSDLIILWDFQKQKMSFQG